jgi:hypothetical protein
MPFGLRMKRSINTAAVRTSTKNAWGLRPAVAMIERYSSAGEQPPNQPSLTRQRSLSMVPASMVPPGHASAHGIDAMVG